MLILTRKIDQSIVIDGKITIMVLGVERDRVKIGIAAPADVAVLREELTDEANVNAPSPLRRRQVRPALAQTQGNLALKPDPKDR
jgi:carbon storage regulator